MRQSRRRFVGLMASAPVAMLLNGCLGSNNPPTRVTVDGGTPAPTRTPTVATALPSAVPFTPATPTSALDPADLHGFVLPIANACLPVNDNLMPGASREYRNGVHEGVDFYFGDSCVVIERGTPVLAAYAGLVVRADHTYVDLTLQQANRIDARIREEGTADDETMDVFRGRQVWIDHGNGVITRYAQLHRVEPDLAEGIAVQAGQRIGAVGESGTPESLTAPGTQLHLHWEVRVGDRFLGQELEPGEVRALYRRLLEPSGS